jgi:glutamine amidotransferase
LPRIIIVDYGVGNLRSVEKAVEKAGGTAKISNSVKDFFSADGIILPGVGAFRDAQANLRELAPSLLEQMAEGKPLLGICLGLQLLFTESTEGGIHRGLDIVRGKVVRLPEGVKVPHMGWNTLRIIDRNRPIVDGVDSESYVYFVHSYYGAAQNKSEIVAETDYGVTFPSIISKGNAYATQFHPEKSGRIGLKILRNFLNIVKR